MKKSELKQLIKEEIKNILSEVKVGDIIKHIRTGAKFKIDKINGVNIEGIFIDLGDKSIPGIKIGGRNKTNSNLIGKTYEIVKESLSESQQVQIQKEMDDLVKKGKERLAKVQELMRKKGYEI